MGAFADLLERAERSPQTDDKYFRMDTPDWNSKNPQSVQAVIRILVDRPEEPVEVYRHWFTNAEGRNAPLNCPGRKGGCPACAARSRAYREGDPGWRDLYPGGTKFLFNVATESEGKLVVRVWAISRTLLKEVDFYTARKGYEDVRTYDLEVTKTRIGPSNLNIAYKVFPSPPTGFTAEYEALLDQRFDLSEEIRPAPVEDIKRAMTEQAGLQVVGPMGNGLAKGATIEQLAELTALAEAKEYTLESIGVNVATLTQEQADRYIADLRS